MRRVFVIEIFSSGRLQKWLLLSACGLQRCLRIYVDANSVDSNQFGS